MPYPHTYFMDRLSDDELRSLFGRREDFFLENVADMDATLRLAQDAIAQAGLTSRVLYESANPFYNLRYEAIGAIPLLGPLFLTALSAARLFRPGADVTLKQTAAQAFSVSYSRKTLA